MLTIEEMKARLARMTYKPGWKISIYQGAFEGVHLKIIADLEDSVELGKTTTFDVHCFIPPMLDIKHFDLYIIDRLIRIESHEAREWLKLDNKSLFYPHCADAQHDKIEVYHNYQKETRQDNNQNSDNTDSSKLRVDVADTNTFTDNKGFINNL